MANVDWSGAHNMDSMFRGFGAGSLDILIDAFPAGFGVNADNMGRMFDGFAMSYKGPSLRLPAFPSDFGAHAHVMNSMFRSFAQGISDSSTIMLDWSATNLAGKDGQREGMFLNFGSPIPPVSTMRVMDQESAQWLKEGDSQWQEGRPDLVWSSTAMLQRFDQNGGETGPDGSFLSTGVPRRNITRIVFEQYLPVDTGDCHDVSAAQNGSILACVEGEGHERRITIGSDMPMSANPNSQNWFAYVGAGGNMVRLLGMAKVDWSGAEDMSEMFFSFGENTQSIEIDKFPEGFGVNAQNMSGMFARFGLNYKGMGLGFPEFPADFGWHATVMNNMFNSFLAEAPQLTNLEISWSRTNLEGKEADRHGMFDGFAAGGPLREQARMQVANQESAGWLKDGESGWDGSPRLEY
jgi:hypothetical protein